MSTARFLAALFYLAVLVLCLVEAYEKHWWGEYPLMWITLGLAALFGERALGHLRSGGGLVEGWQRKVRKAARTEEAPFQSHYDCYLCGRPVNPDFERGPVHLGCLSNLHHQ